MTPSDIRPLSLLMVICSAIGGMLYGYDIGVISGALHFILKNFSLSQDQAGLVVGAVLSGSLLGTLITGPLADRYGRRTLILSACIVFFAGLYFILSANGFRGLFLARLLLGAGVGMVSVAIPLYIAEAAPPSLRGRSITLFQLFLTFGILLAYIADYYLSASGNWRAMFALVFIPSLLLFISMLFLPETPRWLISHRQIQKARIILERLVPQDQIDREITMMERHVHHGGSWRDLFSVRWAFPLTLSLILALCTQLTGINVYLQYAPYLLGWMGLDSHMAQMLATMGLGAVNVAATILAIMMIDRVGRRFLLISGTGGMLLANLLLTASSSSWIPSAYEQMLSLAGLVLYIFSFAIGPGVVVWLVLSELLPTRVRGKGMALCLFVNSLSASLLTSSYLRLVTLISLRGSFIFFSIFSFIYFVVVIKWLPETRGKSLEDIQDDLMIKEDEKAYALPMS